MRFLAIAVAALVSVWSTAGSASIVCDRVNEAAGVGVRRIEICRNSAAPATDFLDAYYQVQTTVTLGSGFGGDFNKSSPQGKALRSLMKSLFSYEKATTVDIGFNLRLPGYTYPLLALVSFKKSNDDKWTSTVQANPSSLLHKLSAADAFNIDLQFLYSRGTKVDLSPAVNVLNSLGVSVATPAAQPIIAAASTVTSALVSAGDLGVSTKYSYNLKPAKGEVSGITYEIYDPGSGQVIAGVALRIVGSRSLLTPSQPLDLLDSTTPTGSVSIAGLQSLPGQVATGQAKNWPVLNNALASTASLQDVPIGKKPSSSDLAQFCNSVYTGLNSSFSLSSFDNLMVRAKLLEAATANIRPDINPYPACFGDGDRARIRTALGIDTEAAPPKPPVTVGPLTDFETFNMIGCLFIGATGDYCGVFSDEAVKGKLSGQITVDALETASGSAGFGIPDSGLLTADDFVAKFRAKFARFRNIDSAAGRMNLIETDGGPTLLFSAKASQPDKKVVSIRITRVSP
jgi:hypothetical protein